ncbi:MAG: NAD(P)-dependent oxidoreductase [Candidatus Nanopelagicales bacterium]
MTSVVLVGLGRMGVPMGGHVRDHLAAHGGELVGYDLSPTARAAASSAGIAVVDDLDAAAAGADVLILMLPSSRHVESVLRGSAGGALRAGSVVVDMGSSEPLSTRALAEELSARGIAMVDAPVSGGVVGAEAASLTVMAGGDDAVLDRVEPLLAATGNVTRTGAVGSGHALKALNNLLSATTLLISSEALHVGRRFGLTDEVMLAVINSSTGRSWSTEFKWPRFVVPESYDSGFAMALLVKDMRIATSLAEELGLPAELGQASLARWADALAALGDGADHTEIARYAAGSEPA